MSDAIIFDGVAKFDEGLSYLKDKMREAARNIVTKGGIVLADNMRREYRPNPGGQRTSARTGRVYWMGTGEYKARPPHPTVRSGNTKNSIRPNPSVAIGIDTWMSETGPHVDYERYPELGTRFIQVPFPAIKMGAEASEEAIKALADAEWAKAEA